VAQFSVGGNTIIESIGNWTNHYGVANSMVENMKDHWE
jgi:hypothetical protein